MTGGGSGWLKRRGLAYPQQEPSEDDLCRWNTSYE